MLAGAVLGVALGWAAMAMAAVPAIVVTPTQGPPGTPYDVQVSCGPQPEIYRANTQDDPVQGTIAPYPATDVSEVAPSTWQVSATAHDNDDRWYARCDQDLGGEQRFDVERPHLWFGPRPRVLGQDQVAGRTTVEGTDCPAGTTATVEITAGSDTQVHQASTDQYGDWTVDLPSPVGSVDITVDASCGAVAYDTLHAAATVPVTQPSTTSATTPPTAPVTPTTPSAQGATPEPGSSSFTG